MGTTCKWRASSDLFKTLIRSSFEQDVHEHIVEFCKDLAGSKFIQNKLETANSEQRERVLSEILPHACELMNDVFGNWVMQKFFIRGSESEKKTLMDDMKGKVLSLSKHMYGCRVIQKVT